MKRYDLGSEDSHESTGAEMRPIVHRSSPVAWTLFLFTLLLAAGGGYFLFQQLKDAKDETARARQATNDLAQNLHQSEETRHELETENQKLAASQQELAADKESLSASLEQLKSTYTTLEDRLQSEIKKGDVHLTEVNGRIRVDLVDNILFDSGQAAVSNRGMEVLARVAQVLASVEDRQIQVSGHTDDSPITERLQATYPTNWELSTARAVNVVRFLSEHGSVPAKRLAATGYGPYQPVASNATPQGRARNRRIEILLMPPLAPKPGSVAVAKSDAPPAASKASAVDGRPRPPARLAGRSWLRAPRSARRSKGW